MHDALAAADGIEVREAIRAMVEAIVLVPEQGRLAIEVRGDLAAIRHFVRARTPAWGPGA